MRHVAVVTAGLLLVIRVASAANNFKSVDVPGTSHENGEARWTDYAHREATDGCESPGVRRTGVLQLRPEPGKKAEPGRIDCVWNTVHIRNDSPRPIQCRVTLTVPTADPAAPKAATSDVVVFPATEMMANNAFGRAVDEPVFSSSCRILPALPLAALDVPEECKPTMRAPSIDLFYPPGSVRRDEEGAVMVEFAFDDATGKTKDIEIMSSSGFADLDNATIKYAKAIRSEPPIPCLGQRYRLNLRFKLRDDMPPALPPTR